jgi:hypothetical protein
MDDHKTLAKSGMQEPTQQTSLSFEAAAATLGMGV